MIRTEIRFKNASFINALEQNNYDSIAEFSRESGLSYMRLIEYANLKYLFKGKDREKIINLLNSDEWSLFEQYIEVIEKTKGQNKKIVKDIPIEKMLPINSKEVLALESDNLIEDNKDLYNYYLNGEMKKSMSSLKDRERKIIELFFGFNDTNKEYSLNEIAKKYSLTRERVRQIKEKAMRRLRHRARATRLEEFIY